MDLLLTKTFAQKVKKMECSEGQCCSMCNAVNVPQRGNVWKRLKKQDGEEDRKELGLLCEKLFKKEEEWKKKASERWGDQTPHLQPASGMLPQLRAFLHNNSLTACSRVPHSLVNYKCLFLLQNLHLTQRRKSSWRRKL